MSEHNPHVRVIIRARVRMPTSAVSERKPQVRVSVERSAVQWVRLRVRVGVRGRVRVRRSADRAPGLCYVRAQPTG